MSDAHYNAVGSDPVVPAAPVLAAAALGVSNEATATACIGFTSGRVAHLAAYMFRVPGSSTLASVAGFAW
jgi:hypothetical protein